MNTEISIGITYYNNDNTIVDALRSVFAQTFQDWEIILIDDNSTDGSFEIVRSVKDPRVRVYREAERKGFVWALNQMTHMATGKYYARMDADDMMHPERLFKQIEYLKTNPDVDVVDTSMYSMDQQCRGIGVRGLYPIDSRPAVLLSGKFLHHATIMGRTEWFRKNPYDLRYIRAEDCELWCRTFKTSHFSRIREALYFVREGLVNVNNYLLSCKTLRQIIRIYGPLYAGKYLVMQLIAESYLKGYAYRLFSLVNSHDVLVYLRNQTLSKKEKAFADSTIKQIKSTHVPGLKEA
ncbi:MAG: glycosyltransferase family 2 protein [Syntrophus sp. (in: bacteria)]